MPYLPTPPRHPTMNDRLTAEIERIRSNSSIPSLDEANVKQGVILPILNILDWDPFNIDEVKPEYSVGGGNVDYSLRLNGDNRVFLEAKRPSQDLEVHQEQLLNYAFKHGVPLAVLTNGLNWWFYLPLQAGSWEERRFSVIDLCNQDVSRTAGELKNFLSKENVSLGIAVAIAENLLEKLWKAQKIEETLPKAWNQLITDPDDQLLALLNQKVMELCGWGADLDQIKRFLANLPKPAPPLPTSTPHPLPSPRAKQLNQSRGNYNGNKIVRFSFDGQTYNVNKSYDLLLILAEQIYLLHPADFHRVDDLTGTKRRYFSRDREGMTQPKAIGHSGYYLETHMAANRFHTLSHRLISLFGYTPDALQIETI